VVSGPRRGAVVVGAALGALLVFVGCDQILGLTGDPTLADGGAGGSSQCVTPCKTDGDCPNPMNQCTEAVCLQGCCGTSPVPMGMGTLVQAPGDCKKLVCDGKGGTTTVPDDSNYDDLNPCTMDSCQGGTATHAPIAGACSVDGGAVCGDPDGGAAGQCVGCNLPSECPAMVCKANTCLPASCGDMVQNGDETDVDCGGTTCPACADHLHCLVDMDCQSKVCDPALKKCTPPTCTDTVKNGGETDVDCGGPVCPKCGPEKSCAKDSDCVGNACVGSVCVPTCTDGVKNGGESDVDCGMVCGPAGGCGTGKTCLVNADCAQGNCMGGICYAPHCKNGVKDSTETDVDCGGPDCPKCGYHKLCSVPGDCQPGLVCFTMGPPPPAQCSCTPGTIYCASTNTCTDPTSDPLNCGYCGHSCQGGTCAGGMGCAPVPFATGQSAPTSLAVDATNLYWTNAGSNSAVMKGPLAGGAPQALASGQVAAWGIAVDATSVYWTTATMNGKVQSVPIAGGAATTIASGQGIPLGIAVDSAYVYWTNSAMPGAVLRAPIGGGAATTLATGTSPWGIAVDATSVYWTDSGSGTVNKAPLAGGTAITLASGQATPKALLLTATDVHWANDGNGSLWHVPIGGGTPTAGITGRNQPWGLAQDATGLYWTDAFMGYVLWTGGGPFPSFLPFPMMQTMPRGVALDAKTVYWTTADTGTVWRVAK
jgi:hypothetical protein